MPLPTRSFETRPKKSKSMENKDVIFDNLVLLSFLTGLVCIEGAGKMILRFLAWWKLRKKSIEQD